MFEAISGNQQPGAGYWTITRVLYIHNLLRMWMHHRMYLNTHHFSPAHRMDMDHFSSTCSKNLSFSLSLQIYIYIYISRERERDLICNITEVWWRRHISEIAPPFHLVFGSDFFNLNFRSGFPILGFSCWAAVILRTPMCLVLIIVKIFQYKSTRFESHPTSK